MPAERLGLTMRPLIKKWKIFAVSKCLTSAYFFTPQGEIGELGNNGTLGDRGLTGIPGDVGERGEFGDVGEAGIEVRCAYLEQARFLLCCNLIPGFLS